jgi:hypothetical protein
MSMLGNDIVIRGRRHDNSYTSETEVDIISKIAKATTNEEKKHFTELLTNIHGNCNDYRVTYHKQGISDMNMVQMLELICDRMSRYESNHTVSGEFPDEEYLSYVLNGFGEVSDDLANVIKNTTKYVYNRNLVVKQSMKKEELAYHVTDKEE